MTKPEAKALAIEMWGYFTAHPEADNDLFLPDYLYEKVSDCHNNCPLCEVLQDDGGGCKACPIKYCSPIKSLYNKWCNAKTEGERQAAAQEILDKIKTWEV